MNTKIADILCLLFVAATIGVAVFLYSSLPEQIPTHWNAAGEVDDYTARPLAVVLLPGMPVLAWVLMKVIPIISPKGFRTTEFGDVINVLQLTLVGFLSLVAILVLLEARGINVYINNIVQVGVGLLFLVLGNYMSKFRKNFFIGIRTPWTLASDEVWHRTHRLGGWLFMLGGLFIIASGFLRVPPLVMVGVLVSIAIFLIAYSYVIYRRVEGFSDDPDDPENDSVTD